MNIDKLLSLIELTKSKYKLIEELITAEYSLGINSSDYIKLINSYKLVCEVYNKKLKELSEIEKQELIEKLKLINPNIFKKLDIEKLLVKDSKYLILKRVLSDLDNESLLNIYFDKKTSDNFVSKIYTILGITTSTDNDSNLNIINEYMNQDFINTFIYTCEENYKNETINEFKIELLVYKYRLIFLSSFVEQRMIITNFSIPNNSIKLVDKISIETTGMTLENYINEFDLSLVTLIEKNIQKILFTPEIGNFYFKIFYLEVLFKLLNNKEYCEIFELELKEYIEEILDVTKKEQAIEIIKSIDKTKKDNINNKKIDNLSKYKSKFLLVFYILYINIKKDDKIK